MSDAPNFSDAPQGLQNPPEPTREQNVGNANASANGRNVHAEVRTDPSQRQLNPYGREHGRRQTPQPYIEQPQAPPYRQQPQAPQPYPQQQPQAPYPYPQQQQQPQAPYPYPQQPQWSQGYPKQPQGRQRDQRTQPPYPYLHQQPYPPALPGYHQAASVRKEGAWSLWWLVFVTCGIYYYFWYARINQELAGILRVNVPADGQWWSQLIPIYNLVGLARTAQRVNAAHAALGSPTRVGVFVTWFWAPSWFWSQTRYLQRRLNILHDVLAATGGR